MLRLLVLMLLVSCGSYHEADPNNLLIQKLRASKSAWISKKAELKGEYTYTVQQSISNDKHLRNWLTTVYVKDDKVVCRYFHQIDDLSVAIWFESFSQGTLGKHAEGSPVRTLDAMYDECGKMALRDDKRVLIYAEDQDGILSSCYVPMEYPSYTKIQVASISGTACAANEIMVPN